MYRAFSWMVGVFGICTLLLVGCENKNEKATETQTGADTQENVAVNNPLVEINTNLGTIVVQLDAEKAPVTVQNFLTYVNDGFYKDTIFHRVIPGFMVQGGGFTADFAQKPTHEPIKNEADNGLKNTRGTVAMARTMDPNSASAQFFINLADNAFLDHRDKTQQGWGYAVFGKVVDGMDVVDAIAKQKTGSRSGHDDVPVSNVVIESAEVIDEDQLKTLEAKNTEQTAAQ
jgi:peptidyl-prolyl cis-trans isomerase B (cyclophilin B)